MAPGFPTDFTTDFPQTARDGPPTMPGSSDIGSPGSGQDRSQSPMDDVDVDADPVPLDSVPDNSSVPKPKRLACMICRYQFPGRSLARSWLKSAQEEEAQMRWHTPKL